MEEKRHQYVPYLTKQKLEKIQECSEKIELFREIWTQIFQTDAENQDFDMDYEETVSQFMENNGERTQILPNIYLNRQDPNNYLTTPIDTSTVKSMIQKIFHTQRAWKIQINKKLLEKPIENSLRYFTNTIDMTVNWIFYNQL